MIQSIPVNLKALAINYVISVETNIALGKFDSVFTRFPDNLVSVVRPGICSVRRYFICSLKVSAKGSSIVLSTPTSANQDKSHFTVHNK